MTKKKLHSSLKNGDLVLKNRIFMAPMTRSRAPQHLATELMAEYYSQRASAGLIISEGTQISEQGIGYISTPGIHSPEQAAAWKVVTDRVHKAGGLIFAQLWHVGRVSHPYFQKGLLPVAPSAVEFEGMAFTPEGPKKAVKPRALDIAEIEAIIGDFKRAAKFAKDAGFDGIEIHGANGYLPAQFLEDSPNKRTDAYGGSVENRARFLLEVYDSVAEVWSKNRISVRLSPRNPYNGMGDSNPEATYSYVIQELAKRGLGILHLMEGSEVPSGQKPIKDVARKLFPGLLILNKGYKKDTGSSAIASGKADAISFGSLFIANPDLPRRFEKDAVLAQPNQATFYGGSEKGYTDYPTLD